MARSGSERSSKPVQRLIRADGRVDIDVHGVGRHPLKDLYFGLLSASWRRLFAMIAGGYVLINVVFALVYFVTGGIEGAREGSLADAFFFSVQTMATIGYGVMHPRTPLANVLVTIEALFGLLGVAMATGVLFAKFARPSSQLVFSKVAVVASRDAVPCLMFRVANERVNHVAEATLKVFLVRNERTKEGESIRRWYELPLQRHHSPLFALTWTAIHPIDDASMLRGQNLESLTASSTEIIVNLTGLDVTLAATIHARHSYVPTDIVWGARFADIIGRDETGRRHLDFGKFHETVPIGRSEPGFVEAPPPSTG